MGDHAPKERDFGNDPTNVAIEAAIAQIAEQIQLHDTFNESVRASFTSRAEEVGKHQNNFREVVRTLQSHEEHIVKTGASSREMAQSIYALIRENANKTAWISSPMKKISGRYGGSFGNTNLDCKSRQK